MNPLVTAQHLLPQQLLSRTTGKLAASKNPVLKQLLMRSFANAYGISLDEYRRKKFSDYRSFNDFFTRELDVGARPIDQNPDSIVCPADGSISQIGHIASGDIFQAKEQVYSAAKLLGSEADASHFTEGAFATIYLAPSNYHRVHTPLEATLTTTRYIPGALFSVNQTTAQHLPNLFARNERMVCLFDINHTAKNAKTVEKMAVVLVGAMIVAGIETVATGKISPSKVVLEQKHNLTLSKGSELGRFYLGSTAIVLLPKSLRSSWLDSLNAGDSVKMGQILGHIR